MKSVKLIASDMDHTLLTEKGELPPHMRDYIQALFDQGMLFSAASGRPLYTLKRLFPDLDQTMGYIADNGGVISYQGELIYKSVLPVETYQKMIAFVDQASDNIGVLCGMAAAYVEEQYRQYDAVLREFYTTIEYVPALKDISVEADKFTVLFPEGDSQKFYDQVYGPQFGDEYSITVAGDMWIDIMNQGVNKGEAMKRFGKHLGITTDQMMAFGDTFNDKEMLQTVKYGYLMGNADAVMDRYVNYHTDTNDHYGVIQIIQKLLH